METQKDMAARVKRELCGGLNEDGLRVVAGRPEPVAGEAGADAPARDCRICRHDPKGQEDFLKVPCCTCNPSGREEGPWLNFEPAAADEMPSLVILGPGGDYTREIR